MIKDQLIDRCISIFEDIRKISLGVHGTPPDVLIIRYGIGKLEKNDFCVYDPQRIYKYSGGELSATDTESWEGVTGGAEVYYRECYAVVGIDQEGDHAYISMFIGPRYARMFQYDIIDDAEEKKLTNERLIAVS